MKHPPYETLKNITILTRSFLVGPQAMMFLPALTLGAYWFGGQALMLFAALLVPAAVSLAGIMSSTPSSHKVQRDAETGLALFPAALQTLEENVLQAHRSGLKTAVFTAIVDDFESLAAEYGASNAAILLQHCADRLVSSMRGQDMVARLDGPRFCVVLAPVRRLGLEELLQISARLQSALRDPIKIDSAHVVISASIGFCTPDRAPSNGPDTLIECALAAAETAAANGAGSIRAYSPAIHRQAAERSSLSEQFETALEAGQIVAWFQPQISTDTGEIAGFEALARWDHPEKGIVLPADFLPAARERGLRSRLSEIMLCQAFSAMREWENRGEDISTISVNFSQEDLANPKLPEVIAWQLDRFDLSPNSFCLEILENVVARPEDDIVALNLRKLSEFGCKLDLDDFGTGYAAISSIRRFGVNRLKIDKSLIVRLDKDREQQKMVSAVLTLAEGLGLETVAEGVETVGEHAILAQLGCSYVQGFSVARPMPLLETFRWIERHRSNIASAPILGKRAV